MMRFGRSLAAASRFARVASFLLAFWLPIKSAFAGPPFVSDDAEPTDYGHYEIYLFANGAHVDGATSGESGIDFNYGGAEDLQLTGVVPMAYEVTPDGGTAAGLGNVELASKYRFLHQSQIGWDVAVFPRVFLPSGSDRVGQQHTSVLLPLWVERDWGAWSTFGGGGCELNRGNGSQDFCLVSWALTREVVPNLRIGAELVHQTPDTKGGHPSTALGFGLQYDLNENYHLLAYAGPGLHVRPGSTRYSWYASLLMTF